METAERLDVLEREGTLLAEAAGRAGDDAPVPACPGWRVADLLRHTGAVHRWAARFAAEGRTRPAPVDREPDLAGEALLSWYRESHRLLVDTLRGTDDATECWTFLPALNAPSGRAFWARRQAHETTVHRVDAESAVNAVNGAHGGPLSPVAREHALDGIEELLAGFHAGERSRVRTAEPRSLRAAATDADVAWTLHLSDGVPRAERTTGREPASGPADCELRGTAEELYLTLWNRRPYERLEVAGDASLARLWRETSGVI